MILLHSSVLGKALGKSADPQIVAWLDQQIATELHVSTVSVGVVSAAAFRSPAFRRQPEIIHRFDELLQQVFGTRIIALSTSHALSAGYHAAVAAGRGQRLDQEAACVAAVASLSDLTVATLFPEQMIAANVNALNPLVAPAETIRKLRVSRTVRAKGG